MVTDTDFSVSGATAFTTISGSIEGGDTMNYTFYGDSGNQAFGRVSEIDSFGRSIRRTSRSRARVSRPQAPWVP